MHWILPCLTGIFLWKSHLTFSISYKVKATDFILRPWSWSLKISGNSKKETKEVWGLTTEYPTLLPYDVSFLLATPGLCIWLRLYPCSTGKVSDRFTVDLIRLETGGLGSKRVMLDPWQSVARFRNYLTRMPLFFIECLLISIKKNWTITGL